MPSKWRSKPRCDGIMAGERTLADQCQSLSLGLLIDRTWCRSGRFHSHAISPLVGYALQKHRKQLKQRRLDRVLPGHEQQHRQRGRYGDGQ